ncbi:MAG: hypothetical protein GWP10_16925 [Nitrospiraceae bacterium]|nr:hypothetical protein [Nitrospiraceae bacterium]
MNRGHWIVTVLVFIGLSLIVGGVVMSSANGWGYMGSSYGMACDGDESIGPGAASGDVSPATAEAVAAKYLDRHRGKDLEIAEIMEFANNFYVQAQEKGTGRYALELLIDRRTGRVYPEPGPNMMWNTKYGRMSWLPWVRAKEEMRITPDEAVKLAQDYLDRTGSGLTAGPDADAFYGYYTLHTVRDGRIAGMLSVNGKTGAVWPHTWHGEFVGMIGGNNEHD